MKPKSLAQLGLALLLLGGAAFLLARAFSGPRINLNPYQALGTIAAEEAARLCGGHGRLVLVVPDPGSDPDPVLDAQIAAFRRSLKHQAGVELAAVETVKMDPFLSMQTGGAIPPDRLEAIRGRHATAAAFVFFLAFPPIPPPEDDSGGKGAPKVMVVSAALPGYDTLLRQGTIHLAIVPQPLSAETPATPPRSTREAFDREYLILRPAP